MKREQKIYCDMDGVLADFAGKRKAVERFHKEKGFFQKLKPIKSSLQAIRYLIDRGYDVNILTASPNEQADYDKRKWLEKYLPELDQRKIIIVRLGEDKADYVDTENAILIDDYTTNLIKFHLQGGKVLKFVNKRDKEIGKHTKYGFPYSKDLRKTFHAYPKGI